MTVSGSDQIYSGGFAGTSRASIQNCYTLSDVTAAGNEGGHVRAFGFVGNAESAAAFDHCYALGGKMTSSGYVSSFLTASQGAVGCYHYGNMELEGVDASIPEMISLTEGQIADGTAFSDFDADVWQLSNGVPILAGIPDFVEYTNKPVYLNKRVTFDARGGSAVAGQTVIFGSKLAEPASPIRDGYTFSGWYKDAACTAAWAFDTDTVTGNMTLYAKWTANAPTPPSGGGDSYIPSTPSSPSTPSASDTSTLPVATTGQNNPTVTTTTTAVPPATSRDGTASSTVDSAVGNEIIRQAVENDSESVVIAPKITGHVTSVVS